MKITKNKNKYFSFLKEPLSKFVVVFVAFSMFISFSNINQTYAYFNDEAVISGNTFTAGTLEIGVDYTDDFNTDLNPGDTTSVTTNISNIGSLDSQYIVETAVVGSDTLACNYITMEVIGSSVAYKGLIKDFVYENPQATVDSSNDYIFTVDPNAPVEVSEKACTFKWKYTAWQTNLDDASLGFVSVKEKVQEINIGEILSIDTDGVVLNEIYPNELSGNNISDNPLLNQEFIELYNMSNSSINVEGWSIGEFSGNSSVEKRHIISSMNTCASGSKEGFARPYAGSSTVIPKKGLLVIELCSKNKLNNNGDTIILHDNNGVIIDSHLYPKTIEGKSHARILDGESWVDPIPTPGINNTATRLDLESEGWDNERIESILAELGIPDDDNLPEEDAILEELDAQNLVIENIEKEIIKEELIVENPKENIILEEGKSLELLEPEQPKLEESKSEQSKPEEFDPIEPVEEVVEVII